MLWRWLAISNQIKNNSCMALESSFSRSRAVINERCSYCHTWEDSYHVVYTSQDTGINCLCWFSYFQGMNKRWHTHRLVLDVQNFLWELSLPNKKKRRKLIGDLWIKTGFGGNIQTGADYNTCDGEILTTMLFSMMTPSSTLQEMNTATLLCRKYIRERQW